MNRKKYYLLTLFVILAIIFIAQITADENLNSGLTNFSENSIFYCSTPLNNFLIGAFGVALALFPLEFKILVCGLIGAYGYRQVQYYKKVENDLRDELFDKTPEEKKIPILHNALPPDSIYNNDFLNYAENLFLIFQDAYEKRDFEIIRPFLSPELFKHYDKLNEQNVENKQYPRFDDQEIISSNLANYKISDDGIYEYIDVKLSLSLLEFAHDDNGNVIDGEQTKRKYNEYLLKFKRLYTTNLVLIGTNCPKCGAPSQITFSGNCDYCHSVIISPTSGFVLYDVSLWLD